MSTSRAVISIESRKKVQYARIGVSHLTGDASAFALVQHRKLVSTRGSVSEMASWCRGRGMSIWYEVTHRACVGCFVSQLRHRQLANTLYLYFKSSLTPYTLAGFCLY